MAGDLTSVTSTYEENSDRSSYLRIGDEIYAGRTGVEHIESDAIGGTYTMSPDKLIVTAAEAETSGTNAITLPDPKECFGKIAAVAVTVSGSGKCTVDGTGTQLDSAATISTDEAFVAISVGSRWVVLANEDST